jgi:hypothetical protein
LSGAWKYLVRRAIGVVALILTLSSCGFFPKTNPLTLGQYSQTLYSDNEALVSNNLSILDPENSFKLSVDNLGKAQGDISSVDKINWGQTSTFIEPACAFEYFWGASTQELAQSKTIVGISVKLSSILMSISNFNNSNFGIVSEGILSFQTSDQARSYFGVIENSIDKCATEVFLEDLQGNVKNAPFTNSKDAVIEYFQPNDSAIIRVGRDGLIHLEVFILTRFSVVNFQIMINDLRLADQDDWGVLNPLINNSISRICLLEDCSTSQIFLERLQRVNPTPMEIEFPEL